MKQRLWLAEAGVHWSTTIVWKKQHFVMGAAKYQRMYEPCFYGWIENSSFCDERDRTDVWEFDRPTVSELHPTMKPLDLCAYAIRNSSRPAGIVLDMFGGSGSTLIAADMTGRVCCMTELEPGYCDVIVQRYKDYCIKKGEKPVVRLNGKAA
jgi:DNA modification methylase